MLLDSQPSACSCCLCVVRVASRRKSMPHDQPPWRSGLDERPAWTSAKPRPSGRKTLAHNLADRGEDLVAVDHDRECSARIELLPGLLKLEKGLCRGPESAPRGMPPISPPSPRIATHEGEGGGQARCCDDSFMRRRQALYAQPSGRVLDCPHRDLTRGGLVTSPPGRD